MFCKIGAVAIRLVEILSKSDGHKLYMDNLFTSIRLLKHFKSQGIWAIEAIRGNRLKGAEKLLKSKKRLSKIGRGFDFRIDANTNTTVLR